MAAPDWDDFPNFGGAGSMHELRDEDGPGPSRLHGLKSVSRQAERAFRKAAQPAPRHPIGFHRPR